MTISKDYRQGILNYVDSHGHSVRIVKSAALIFGCCARSIWAFIALRKSSGTVDPKRTRHGVKNWVGIPVVELDLLLEQIILDPTLYISEMANYLHGLGYKLHTTTQIWKALDSRGITRKILEVHAKEQDEKRRQAFLKMTSMFTAEQRLYIDESHITEKSARRRYGRSPSNVRAFVYKNSRLGHRGGCSAIAALSTKGVEMVSMHDDIVDSNTYLRVLEFQILPLMNAFPLEKSVLISDNAPVHNKAAIMTLCQSVGVSAIFFEPYSYDYNPIELVFHCAKSYLRHTWPSDDHNFPVSKNFEHALYNCITGDISCNFFVHCHINVTEDERDRANDR